MNTLRWFQKAVRMPISKNIQTQLGVHFEEVREMIIEIEGLSPETTALLDAAAEANHNLAEHLKHRDGVIVVRETNRINMIDAICDQLVTATGVAHMLHMDPVGGLDEVNRSNWSKFDENGEPYFDANQKVAKGPNYRKANLAPFV
jgi:predicted HAD superfamily Cof-like phosphohydrolase